jgi:hypothetical protein
MFDRAARTAWRVGAAPYVEIAVLTALAMLVYTENLNPTIVVMKSAQNGA